MGNSGKRGGGQKPDPSVFKGKMLSGLETAFAVFQAPGFIDICAIHKKMAVLNTGGLRLLAKRRPVIGYMGGFLGGPELAAPPEKWHDVLASLPLSHIMIQTNAKCFDFEAYRLSPNDNYHLIIDLRDGMEKLLNAFQRKKRQSIKKGLKAKTIDVRPARKKSELKQLYEIIWKNSGQGRLFDVASFDFLADLMSSRFGTPFLALHRHTIVGGAFLIHHRGVVTALSGGFDHEYRHFNIWDMLYYHIMQWGIAKGCLFLDLGHQSMSQNRHLVSYKMRFAPKLMPAYIYQAPISTSKAKLLDTCNNIYSRLRDRFDRSTNRPSSD